MREILVSWYSPRSLHKSTENEVWLGRKEDSGLTIIHKSRQAGSSRVDPAKASGPQHSDLVSEDRMINPRPVGQTTACIPKSHIPWFPFLLLQKIEKKIKGFPVAVVVILYDYLRK